MRIVWFAFPRTIQKVACITLMPTLCRNHPLLSTPMPNKTTDMHFTARVHWCTQTLYMYNYMCRTRVLAQHWISVTVHVVSVVPVGICLGMRPRFNYFLWALCHVTEFSHVVLSSSMSWKIITNYKLLVLDMFQWQQTTLPCRENA